MAFRDDLSTTQQFLLSLLCFPLRPFYLCCLCLTDSKESKIKPHNLAQAEAAKVQATVNQPQTTGNRVTVEIHPRTTSQIGKTHFFNRGTQVFPDLRGQDNEGFQDDRDQQPSLPQGQDLPGFPDYEEKRRSLPDEQDLHAYPWDRSNLKSMPIDLQQFKNLDAYAAKVNTRSNVEDLVSVLLQEAHSDLEKVRAIWIWISHHIEYDVEAYHDESKIFCKPAEVLQSGKSVCAGYSNLFEKMCSIAGIQCKNLSGHAKGRGYKPGKVFRGDSNHAWNAVFLHGRWHLLDSTWGSGYTMDKFIFRYNEFYFLTHPALFIAEHFPEDYKWQLLKPTLTLPQFERHIQYRSCFFARGLVAATPATAVIQTENGKATIVIESCRPTLFMSALNKLNENCLIMLQRNGMKLEVYPQQTGTHCLQIFAKHFQDMKGSYNFALECSLECSSVDKSISLPKDLIYPVGPNWFTEQVGILKASPPGPVIHTDDGRCAITFTQSEDLDFFATLMSNNSRIPEDIRRRHIWKTRQGNQAALKIHLPHAGHFALSIWAKKTSDPGGCQCALSYLLSCPNKSVAWPVFPQTFTNWEDDYELVAPLAGVLPANSQVQFKLKLPGICQAYVKCGEKPLPLTLSETGFWEGACNTSSGETVSVQISKEGENVRRYILEYKVKTR
ncbi:kyphoscoliosis peptidase-like isoform X2 [Sphaerodactylus townsendi]|uniref:kyphoscoliosis peptidase-like isoform X2 n=1 Tax=Sphaerodactylus townsendi TaxID=933632 RepID=UPI0020271913|nr:kyphoscoliosis peptidase-like isoform X2 [Sphaerodactylus townsendi]